MRATIGRIGEWHSFVMWRRGANAVRQRVPVGTVLSLDSLKQAVRDHETATGDVVMLAQLIGSHPPIPLGGWDPHAESYEDVVAGAFR